MYFNKYKYKDTYLLNKNDYILINNNIKVIKKMVYII